MINSKHWRNHPDGCAPVVLFDVIAFGALAGMALVNLWLGEPAQTFVWACLAAVALGFGWLDMKHLHDVYHPPLEDEEIN